MERRWSDQATAVEVDAMLIALGSELGIRIRDLSGKLPREAAERVPHATKIIRISQGEVPFEAAKASIRSWLRPVGWLVTQEPKHPFLLWVAPMRLVTVPVAYHATNQAILPAIERNGLLPSSPERSNTERIDCEGNVYLCAAIGKPMADPCAQPELGTAHWWCWQLGAGNASRQCIIEVDLARTDALVYQDFWSTSGLVVEGVDCLPPDMLRVVWKSL